jgi:hypothetical protein
LLYTVDDPSGTPASNKVSANRFLGQGGFIPGGRLTLSTGVPVTTSDVTGAGTLYYAIYTHNRIRIFDGTRWKYYAFAERSLALTLTADKNYDVFIYDNSGTLTLELSAAWTNDTTRADALTTQDGVYVKDGATSRLWLGTIRASGTDVTEDSGNNTPGSAPARRFVSNFYNRVARPLKLIESADSWTYSTATIRSWNNSANNRAELVLCSAEIDATLDFRGILTQDSSNVVVLAVGVDSTSALSGISATYAGASSGAAHGMYHGFPGLGRHFLQCLERGGTSGTTTFFGDGGAATVIQGGAVGFVWG